MCLGGILCAVLTTPAFLVAQGTLPSFSFERGLRPINSLQSSQVIPIHWGWLTPLPFLWELKGFEDGKKGRAPDALLHAVEDLHPYRRTLGEGGLDGRVRGKGACRFDPVKRW